VEERRTVTTLFCDIVGFTAMTERADPEDVDRLLGEYAARSRAAVEAHGGIVEKFIGDAVVAVFGVPAVHEDDAERAVRAGLRLVEDLEGMTRPEGAPLEVRVGVNTGPVLVRLDVDPASGRGFLTGDAVNTAARLQGVTPPMTVAVGEATHAATERVFRFDACHPVALKGKSEPVKAWIAVEPLARTGSELRSFTTSFFGREEELAQLTELLERAAAGRAVQAGLIVGEPGIGKSRLLAEFAHRLDERPDDVTWRQGRCLPFGSGITFWALSEIVRDCAGILETDGVARAEALLETVLPKGDDGDGDGPDDRDHLRARLRPLLGLASDEAPREENFTAWRDFLEDLAAVQPTVIVVEDVHWADEGMLAFLDFLAQGAAAVPLLVLATGRQEVLELTGGGAAFVAAAERVPLGALSGDETAQLVLARLGAKSLSVKLQGTLLERSGGNPLFAEELVRLLQDRDLLVTRGGQMMLCEGAELPTPESIGALIAARLDVLSPERKALLADASVVGRTFWAGAVAAVGSAEPAEVYQGLMELVAKELVRPERTSSMEGETEFVFVHALVRDVAYGQLTRTDRAQKHAALAGWLEERTAGRTEDLAEILAYHYGTALEMATACGLDDLEDELAEPTTRNLELAGGRAAPLDAAAAAAHFARAQKVADEAARPKRRWLLSRKARRTLRRRAPLLIAAAAVIAVAAVAALAIYEFRPQHADAAAGPVKLTPAQIAEKYMPSVVKVTASFPTVVEHKLHWERRTVPGVVASKNGLIFASGASLRNASLGWYARNVTVGIWDSAGMYKTVSGRRLDNDWNPDVAIFKVDPRNVDLVPIPPGDSASMQNGMRVVSLGRGGSGNGNLPWQASGTITYLSRGAPTGGSRAIVYEMQTSLQSHSVRAGCPLVDVTGRLVGIVALLRGDDGGVSASATTESAIGIGYYQQCAADYGRQGASPRVPELGVHVRTVTPRLAAKLHLASTSGALVEYVLPDSPASKAGVQGGKRVVKVGSDLSEEWERKLVNMSTAYHMRWTADQLRYLFKPEVCITGGDIIVGMNGGPIKSAIGLCSGPDGICQHKPGQVVTISLLRDGKPLKVKAKLVPDLLWDFAWQ
jgi:class 3 adenylate cyclase/S1-C subfamily serine protease